MLRKVEIHSLLTYLMWFFCFLTVLASSLRVWLLCMRSVYLQVSLLPTPYFAVITAHYYLCNFSACSTVNKNSLKKTRQKENNEICVCNCIYDCLIGDYLATLLHSATSSPVVIQNEHHCITHAKQFAINLIILTAGIAWSNFRTDVCLRLFARHLWAVGCTPDKSEPYFEALLFHIQAWLNCTFRSSKQSSGGFAATENICSSGAR